MSLAEGLKRLVEHARRDPTFFHELVFDPEKVIRQLNYLDRKAKAALLSINPENVIRNLVPSLGAWCGDTCGGSSCNTTCGSDSCRSTCGSSCGTTCGSSCTDTSKMGFQFVPDEPAVGGAVKVAAGGARVSARRAGARARK